MSGVATAIGASAVLGAGAGIYEQNQAANAQKGAIAPLQQANSTLYSKAEGIANTPYTAYTGPQVAPITGSQQQAIGMAQTNANDNIAGGDYAKAAGQADFIGNNQWNTQTAQKYMNPYTDAVTQKALDAEQRNYVGQLNTQQAGAASQGAFGGDRATLAASDLAGQNELAQGTTSAQLHDQAYNNAVSTWQADNNRASSAASAYDAAGNDITNMNAAQIKDLLATGGVAQATQQMQLNANYNNYLDQRGWAANELQPLLSATGGKGTPAGVAPANTASDLVGAATALAGYYGSTNSGGVTDSTGANWQTPGIDPNSISTNMPNFTATPVVANEPIG